MGCAGRGKLGVIREWRTLGRLAGGAGAPRTLLAFKRFWVLGGLFRLLWFVDCIGVGSWLFGAFGV